MKKGLCICFIFLLFCSLILVQCVSTRQEPETTSTIVPVEEEPTQKPTENPSPEPTPESISVPTPEPTRILKPTEEPSPEAGELWFELSEKQIIINSPFSTELRINTGDRKVAAYGIHIKYDPSFINVDAGMGNNGVVTGADGFVAAVNAGKPGTIMIAGFDVMGKGPGKNLHFFTIYWKAVKKGSTTIEIKVNQLADEVTKPIGIKKGRLLSFEVK
ncbi:MAG: hypothetical protein JXB88_27075 [Spirochaetales bacterium]|nr:hypothetical protein [Spirochaetales bacterium]